MAMMVATPHAAPAPAGNCSNACAARTAAMADPTSTLVSNRGVEHMAAVPVILNGVMMPKGKGANDKPIPAVFTGYLSIQGLSVGGGPILPDNPPPEPTH